MSACIPEIQAIAIAQHERIDRAQKTTPRGSLQRGRGVALGLFRARIESCSSDQWAFQADQLEASRESTVFCVLRRLVVGQRDDPDLRGRLGGNDGRRCGRGWRRCERHHWRRCRRHRWRRGRRHRWRRGRRRCHRYGAGWAAAMALSRVPPCQELLSTKSCSMFTLPTVTFVVWNTLSFRLVMTRYWPAGRASS